MPTARPPSRGPPTDRTTGRSRRRPGAVVVALALLLVAPALAGCLDGWALFDGADDGADDADDGDGPADGLPDPGPWEQRAKLIPQLAEFRDQIGWAVALDGDTAIVASPRDNGVATRDSGAAWVFVRDGSSWTQTAQVTPEDPGHFDLFAWDVALDGGTLVAGAPGDDDAGTDAGAAHVYVRASGQGAVADATGSGPWERQAVLTADGARAFDLFGMAVALDGDTLVVGAANRTLDDGTETGAAFVFERVGGTWTQTAELVPPEPYDDAQFGTAVAVAGDLLVVGAARDGPNATGGAYVYERDGGGGWTLAARMAPQHPRDQVLFGLGVATDGTRVAVGAPGNGTGGSFAGAVFVYADEGGQAGWSLEGVARAAHPREHLFIGGSIALEGDTLVSGGGGVAWAFVRAPDGSWTQQGGLVGAGDDVALDGETVVAGNSKDATAAEQAGAALVWVRTG